MLGLRRLLLEEAWSMMKPTVCQIRRRASLGFCEQTTVRLDGLLRCWLMSKPMILALVAWMAAAVGLSTVPHSAGAAELQVPIHMRHRHTASWCGPCGCLHVSYDYHRELRSTYGLSFDPRNFDQTQPYYFLGRVRAYPRYWCDAEPLQ